MGCACNGSKGTTTKYAWSNGTASKVYTSEVEAKARKNRDGGTYRPVAG
jgi:hypothetical protein